MKAALTKFLVFYKTVSCKIKFAKANVRALSHVCDVHAKSILKRVCGAIAHLHTSACFCTHLVVKLSKIVVFYCPVIVC